MRLEIHNKLGKPQIIECTRLLVRDGAFDNPVAVIIEHVMGQIWMTTSDEGEKFHAGLQAMGVDETIIVETINPADLKAPPGTLILPP